jgi:hypothetical protein
MHARAFLCQTRLAIHLNDFLDVDHFLNDLFNFHWHFNNFLDLMEQGYQIWGALAPSCSAMGVPGH